MMIARVLVFVLVISFCLAKSKEVHEEISEFIQIVGGVQAEKGEFPYIVHLRIGPFMCGGSILNYEWVVTAAHCTINNPDPADYTVIAGEYILDTEEGTEQTRSVTRVINHPEYNPNMKYNDIALLKVSKPFNFNKWVQAVHLPYAGFNPSGDLTVAGWGTTTEGGSISQDLLKVTLPFVSDALCRLAYSVAQILDSMMCAGLAEGGKDSCQGDSGGPLICKMGNGIVLCGVVSWGNGCARPGIFGVYTEVSFFLDWIKMHIGSSYSCNHNYINYK